MAEKPKRDRTVRPSRIQPDGLYTHGDLVVNLKVGPSTITRWTRQRQNPLKALRPGTKVAYFLGADVIEFLKIHG